MVVGFLRYCGTADPHDDLMSHYQQPRVEGTETYEAYERRLRKFGNLLDKSEEDLTRTCWNALSMDERERLGAAGIFFPGSGANKATVNKILGHLRNLEELEVRNALLAHGQAAAVQSAVKRGGGGKASTTFVLDDGDEHGQVMVLPEHIVCRTCKEVGHHFLQCALTQCLRCQEVGHVARNCKKASVPCEKCGRTGHASSTCRVTRPGSAGGKSQAHSGLTNEAAVVEVLVSTVFKTPAERATAVADLKKLTSGLSYEEASAKLKGMTGWARSMVGGAGASSSQDFRQGQ